MPALSRLFCGVIWNIVLGCLLVWSPAFPEILYPIHFFLFNFDKVGLGSLQLKEPSWYRNPTISCPGGFNQVFLFV